MPVEKEKKWKMKAAGKRKKVRLVKTSQPKNVPLHVKPQNTNSKVGMTIQHHPNTIQSCTN